MYRSFRCRISDDLLQDEHSEYLVQREEGDGTEEPNIMEPAIPQGELPPVQLCYVVT